MKYVLNENKLENLIIKFLNATFPPSEIDWEHPVDYFHVEDEYGNEVEETDIDYLKKMYFYKGNSIFILDLLIRHKAFVEVDYYNGGEILEDMFGDLWKEPFKVWFKDNFGHEIIDVYLLK